MTEKKQAAWWEMACEGDDLKKCRKDPRFPYIVTLARATNALHLVVAIVPHIEDVSSPSGARDFWNAFFFTYGVLYESLQLTKKMNKAFAQDEQFQKGLRTLLKDPRAKRVENPYWNPVRNRAVFHFDPSWVEERLKNSNFDKCIFVRGELEGKSGVYFPFSDEVAFEIMVGLPFESKDFMPRLHAMAQDTGVFAVDFLHHAENLIVHILREWGFKRSEIPAAARSSEDQASG